MAFCYSHVCLMLCFKKILFTLWQGRSQAGGGGIPECLCMTSSSKLHTVSQYITGNRLHTVSCNWQLWKCYSCQLLCGIISTWMRCKPYCYYQRTCLLPQSQLLTLHVIVVYPNLVSTDLIDSVIPPYITHTTCMCTWALNIYLNKCNLSLHQSTLSLQKKNH